MAWLEEHELGIRKAGTIRNHFTVLRRNGKVKPCGSDKGVIPIHDAARVTVKEDTQTGPDGIEKAVHDSRPLRGPGTVNEFGGDGMAGDLLAALDAEISAEDPTGEGLL